MGGKVCDSYPKVENSMRKRVLLTGGTGFVGKQILGNLIKSNVDIRLVVRNGTDSRLKPYNVSDLVYTDDIFSESRKWWSQVCHGVHTVVHAAWFAEPGIYMQSPKNMECMRGTLDLALGGVDAGIQRFVGIGSCSEYDLGTGNLSVNTPLKPTTAYGGAKAGTFLALSNYFGSQKIDFAWCRLFYLYGLGEHAQRLVPYLHENLSNGESVNLTSGNQVRDYLDVVDAGVEISNIALGEACGAINICSGKGKTVRQFAEEIADIYGRRDLLRFGMRPENPYDPPVVVGIKNS